MIWYIDNDKNCQNYVLVLQFQLVLSMGLKDYYMISVPVHFFRRKTL
jgi:hypothetical protein